MDNNAPAETPAPQPDIPGVNPQGIPAATRAEFGVRPLDKTTDAELKALEAEINSRLANPQPPAAPALPVQAAPSGAVPTLPPAPQAAVPPATTPAVPAQPAPVGPVAVPPGVQVPPKFQTPDGQLDAGKLEKSLQNLNDYLLKEQMISRYRQTGMLPPAAPPEMYPHGMAPMQGYPPPMGYPPVYGAPAAPAPAPQPSFMERVHEDLSRDPAQTVINLMSAASEAARQKIEPQVRGLQMQLELIQISSADPWVFQKEGLDRLTQIRMENPWLDQSPTPWLHAYKLSGRGQGAAPTAQGHGMPIAPARGNGIPAAPTHVPPVLPGGQQPPTPVPSGAPIITSEADLRRYLNEKFTNNPRAQYEYLESVINSGQRRG